MHENLALVLTLTGGLAAALALGYVTHRLRLSPIVGYLLAGIAVGPRTPGFVADHALAGELAEIGVILLMFGVGLHFHLKELLAVRRIAVPGALIQCLATTGLGVALALAFGWGSAAGVVFGVAISVASTVVLIRVLADNNDLHTPTGHIAVGWLVVEDLLTVVVLVVLPAVFATRSGAAPQLGMALLAAALKIGVLIAFTFLVGGRVIPRLLGRAAATNSRELFTLTVLVLALGIAVGSAKLFGVSMALGAFLAGMVVGRSDFSLRAATEALPMRDAFAVLFFVSVGMLFSPAHLVREPGVVAATLGVVVVGKPVAAFAIVMLLRYPLRTALSVAVALAQIGEFSFILAAMGTALGILPDSANNAVIAAAIISISVNPLLYRLVDPVERWASRRRRLSPWLRTRAAGDAADAATPGHGAPSGADSSPRHRAVVVGYGPVGRTVARLLGASGISSTVIEMNLTTIHQLREARIPAVYGDASHRETLVSAGVDRAGTFILSASSIRGAAEVIRMARELNPAVRVLVRSSYLRDAPELRRAGADGVFSGEGEVALAMTTSILHELGATPEQIDRERERVRDELFGAADPSAQPAIAREPAAPR